MQYVGHLSFKPRLVQTCNLNAVVKWYSMDSTHFISLGKVFSGAITSSLLCKQLSFILLLFILMQTSS